MSPYDALWETIGDGTPTPEEAVRAVRKLLRFKLGVTEFGRTIINTRLRSNRYCSGAQWELRINPNLGWRQLVLWTAMYAAKVYHRENFASMEGTSERFALAMTRELIKRGWLGGPLQPEPKPRLTTDQKRKARLKQIDAGLKRWGTKRKRAETAIKTLTRERTRIQRRLES
jgi:hypothetical protein